MLNTELPDTSQAYEVEGNQPTIHCPVVWRVLRSRQQVNLHPSSHNPSPAISMVSVLLFFSYFHFFPKTGVDLLKDLGMSQNDGICQKVTDSVNVGNLSSVQRIQLFKVHVPTKPRTASSLQNKARDIREASLVKEDFSNSQCPNVDFQRHGGAENSQGFMGEWCLKNLKMMGFFVEIQKSLTMIHPEKSGKKKGDFSRSLMFVSHESSESVDSCKTKGQVVRPILEPPTLNTPEKPWLKASHKTKTNQQVHLILVYHNPFPDQTCGFIREFLLFSSLSPEWLGVSPLNVSWCFPGWCNSFSTKKNAAGKSLPPAATNATNISKRRNCHAPPYEDHQDWAMESPAASLMQLRRRGAAGEIPSLHCLSRGSDVTTNVFWKLSLSKKWQKRSKGPGNWFNRKSTSLSMPRGATLFSSTIYCCQIIFPTHSV